MNCKSNKCAEPVRSKNALYCGKHYQRFRKYGDPDFYLRKRESHGLYKHELYPTWLAIKNRCLNSKCSVFKYYGGRGITIYDGWRDSFSSFLNDIGERPDNMTIDRIDNDGNYEPGNVRWANRKTQAVNRGENRNNSSGHRGIVFKSGKWQARIMVNYREKYLGRFLTLEDAISARKKAEAELF